MKTHAIVQSLVICLLLVWTAVWDVPSSDAGGPPIRLAVERRIQQINGVTMVEPVAATQLLPTEWDRPTQLIPTKIDHEKTQLSQPQIAHEDHLFDTWLHYGGKKLPWAELGKRQSIEGFLTSHLSKGPSLPIKDCDTTDDANAEAPLVTPWIVGKQGELLVIRYDFIGDQIGDRLFWSSVHGKLGYRPSLDKVWLPARQWWHMARQPIPKGDS